jgi:hypothetical protein
MSKTRRVTNLTEIIQESQRYSEVVQPTPEQQEQPLKEPQPQAEQKPPELQPENTTIPENNNPTLLQSSNTITPKKWKTDEREKKMYYLDPGQSDKLDDLRREYKQRTKIKLNEQDLMRLIINRITIDQLL